MRSHGYKREVHNGETLYCRSEALLGSRFEKKVCSSAYAIENNRQVGQEAVSKTQLNTAAPPGK